MADTWILLRGLIREQRHWEDFPGLLRRENPGKQIVTLDVAGNGTRYREPSPLTIRGMTESIRTELHQRGIKGPFHLVAISMGAMLGLEWLVEYPGEIQSAVLMNTSLRAFNPFYDRFNPRTYPLLGKALLTPDTMARERHILTITSNLRTDHELIARRWAGYAREHPTSRLNALRQLTAAARYRCPRHAPHNRILILNGGKDRLVSPDCSIRLARQWLLPFRQNPEAGHDLALDAGSWSAAEASEFLEKTGR
ncbi:MAG: alpha/beta hydrolase [Ketobacteraceae bacterium]|nr:alpha/beta hydrolase [Ketobacteraceae bacterium]